VLVVLVGRGAAAAPPATAPPSPEGPAAPPARAAPDAFEPPFPMEDMQLSQAVSTSVETNLDLRGRVVDVEVSEAGILAALGAYDVTLTAGVATSLTETPQRGSSFTISSASRSTSGYFGFGRALESGGRLDLRVDVRRGLTDQLRNFLDQSAGTVRLADYSIAPTLTFTHPLLRGLGVAVNRANIDKARLATSQAEAVELQFAHTLVRDIVSAYWDVLFAKRDLENKRIAVDLARTQLQRTEAQVAAGRLPPVDAKAVEQSLATRESEVLLAENTLLDRSLTLRTLMGQGFDDREVLGVLPATDPVLVQPQAVDHVTEVEKAMRTNPQIRQLQLALASRRIDEIVAANQRLPQLDFRGSFSATGRSVDSTADPSSGQPAQKGSWGEAFNNFFNDDIARDGLLAQYSVNAGLDFTWAVQNRAAKGAHEQAASQIRRAEVNLEQIRQTVAAAVIRATSSLRTASKRIEVSEVSVELAQQNLDAEQARFDVGRSTNYDVMFRIDELSRARATALGAQIDYLKAMVQLQALTGELLPAYGLDLASARAG
jgi:outer membrane protein TolC